MCAYSVILLRRPPGPARDADFTDENLANSIREAAGADAHNQIFFDASSTLHRARFVEMPAKAGKATSDDACYATFDLENGTICQFNFSWDVRVRRDDLFTMQIDGTEGSAVATLRECRVQSMADTPTPVWNPDIVQPIDFYNSWKRIEDGIDYDNAFKAQWEKFIRHGVADELFRWDLMEGAKGVQLAEAGLQSWKERRWVDLEPLS